MWFVDDAWTPALIAGGLAVLLAFLGKTRQQKGFFFAAAGCFAVVIAAFVIDMFVQTDAELVEVRVIEVVRSFEAKDLEKTWSYFSPRLLTPEVKSTLTFQNGRMEFPSPLRITDIQVKMMAQNSRAESIFRVNGTITYDNSPSHQPWRFVLTWEQQGGEWMIVSAIPINPLNGDPMPNAPSFK